MRRRSLALIALTLATMTVACSKNSGVSPTAPSVPIPTTTGSLMVRLQSSQPVSGVNVVITGPVQQSRMTDAPGSVMFSNLTFGGYTVTASGAGLLNATQTVDVVQPQQQVTLQLAVAGTPWSSLPPLSDAARDLITRYNLDSRYNGTTVGVVKRWADGVVIRVYGDPGFRREDVVAATMFWTNVTSGKVNFQIVDTPQEAQIVMDFVWPPPGNYQVPDYACGVEGPDVVRNGIILSGFGHYAFKAKPECAGNGDHKIGLAHGIGHILGLLGHTSSGSDVMSSPKSIWSGSPLLSEFFNWLYVVQPNTRPV